MPPTVTNTVASRTRKRLRADHSMTLASMKASSVTFVGRRCCVRADRTTPWRDLRDDPFTRCPLHELERNRGARLEVGDERTIGGLEVHRHAGPLERRDRPVR